MWKLLDEFSTIIKDTTIHRYEVSAENTKLRMKLSLTDGTDLFVRETVIPGKMRKYSYHWQDKDGKLIKRWDNAPDWDVETFPHHLHIGENGFSFYDRSLVGV